MNKRKWMALLVSGGTCLQLAACASDVGYYLLTSMVDYLPTLLESLLGTTSTA